ncbi:MAG TPA: hypothetical protein VM889_10975 [Candidatus Thermoplasmatota archaeon]|nr:hypothetical protein [Candidatus Thermoplasmatota archaeon]
MRALALAAVLLAAGCLGLEREPLDNLPSRLDHDDEPPVPAGAAEDGPRRLGRCFKHAATVFVGPDATFDLPANASFAAARAEAWTNATLAIVTASPGHAPVRVNATPLVLRENGTARLAFRGGQGDEGHNFIEDMAYGRWYPWNVTLAVASDDPALDDLGRATTLSGWILVAAGGKPGQSDDRIHAYLARERLVEDPFLRVPIPGGDFFLTGRGVCAD